MSRLAFGGLWRHPDFLRLWSGQTVSEFGSTITRLALPLAAVQTLHANAAQMGYLGFVEFLPFILIGLVAGALVDRMRRRPVMLLADVGRALFLATIPAAALFGHLAMSQLYAVAFLVGILTVFFDVAYQSYLPSLVGGSALVEGNSKLEVTRSAAQIAGPGLGGFLVQLLTAPIAITADAFSFIVSVASLVLIRQPEPKPDQGETPQSLAASIREGLGVVLKNPTLRGIAFCTGTLNLFSNAWFAIFVLFLERNLHLSALWVGFVFASMGPGALLGALVASPLAKRFGLGVTIIAAAFVSAMATLLVPAAGAAPAFAVPLLLAQGIFSGGLSTIYNINQVSLRQVITPERLLGRMNATMRFIVWGTIPIGSLIGGLLGTALGLETTLVIAAVGECIGFLWVLFSPLRHLREQPSGPPEPVPAAGD